MIDVSFLMIECNAHTVDIKPSVPLVVNVGCRHVDGKNEGGRGQGAPFCGEDSHVRVVAT